MKRPVGLTVIGWALVGIASLFLLSALINLPLLFRTTSTPGYAPTLMERSLPVGVALQFMVGGLSIVSGVALLRNRRWAPLAAEALAWIMMTSVVLGGLGVSVGWILMSRGTPFDFFVVSGAVMAAVIGVVLAIPFVVMIWTLHRPEIRDYLASA